MNREKVMKAIEICIKNGCKNGIPNQLCPYSSEVGCDLNQILADALELLKAQRETIDELISADKALKLLQEQEAQKFFVDEYGKITPLPVVVRCKDCKHFEPDGIYTMCYRHNGLSPNADWFCADGERRTDDA